MAKQIAEVIDLAQYRQCQGERGDAKGDTNEPTSADAPDWNIDIGNKS